MSTLIPCVPRHQPVVARSCNRELRRALRCVRWVGLEAMTDGQGKTTHAASVEGLECRVASALL